MTQHKSLKRRVRVRMDKTGERYTSARHQVLAKVPGEPPPGALTPAAEESAAHPTAFSTSDTALRRATGHDHAEWFALLDAWGSTKRKHPEIARWLSTAHGVPSWWCQNITVDYERARRMRGRHEMADGFSITVTRTVDVDADHALTAFTDASIRAMWLDDAPMQPRPTQAGLTARFDWADPASRLVVTVVPKAGGKSSVAVTHERLPDAESALQEKGAWRDRLAVLKTVLKAG